VPAVHAFDVQSSTACSSLLTFDECSPAIFSTYPERPHLTLALLASTRHEAFVTSKSEPRGSWSPTAR
jgi:hypothetical protein